ncbi:MAG: hypothetical protein IJ748_04790, partial [Bacteroidales bacterium]|nr:hypothetical protein [Bacteroidales bacterium]
NADIRRAVRTYFEQQIHMLEKNKVDVIAHCYKITMHNRERYFSVEDKWYQDLLWDLFSVMIEHGVICEINTRGLYKKRHNDYYPSKRFWKELNAKGLKFILASDCHQRDETDFYFDEAKDILCSAGVRSLCYFENSWREYAI